ncbi:hypothetical protein [Sphingopyxis sp. MWB1]|uniref:hypothetical protein n=1 Tax=Sphingopyxis sp. MWB1 TaxID=1537715 RepID=UPI00051A7A8F|nr:hypothetical protein [Sphingopyxis sp. MWB1]
MPRWTLAALPLVALAAPLPAVAAEPGLERAAETLNDPATQDRIADAMGTLVGALMQVNIGPLAEAVAKIDPDSDAAYLPADATLGEMAGRDAHDAERTADQVRQGARVAGQAAATLVTYAPILKEMASDMIAQMARQTAAPRD